MCLRLQRRGVSSVSPRDRHELGRCNQQLLGGCAGPDIPVYAECLHSSGADGVIFSEGSNLLLTLAQGAFGFYAGLNVIAFVAIFLFLPETKERTLVGGRYLSSRHANAICSPKCRRSSTTSSPFPRGSTRSSSSLKPCPGSSDAGSSSTKLPWSQSCTVSRLMSSSEPRRRGRVRARSTIDVVFFPGSQKPKRICCGNCIFTRF